jgi:hypothetical protein
MVQTGEMYDALLHSLRLAVVEASFVYRLGYVDIY